MQFTVAPQGYSGRTIAAGPKLVQSGKWRRSLVGAVQRFSFQSCVEAVMRVAPG